MASEADIERLKRIGPQPTVTEYADEELGALIDEQNGDVRLAAGFLWEERMVETSALVDITEGSSSRKMKQEFDNAVKMTQQYLGGEFSSDPTGRTPATVHKIVRE